MRALYVKPANATGKLPGVVVVHENRGLNPYIEDVARRLGVAGFLALAPDVLTPVGGYQGDDEKAAQLQASLDTEKKIQDFVAAAVFLKSHADCTGKVGVTGFCYGGGVSNQLAVRLPDLSAAAPFYGRQPAAADVPKIKAALLIHYAAMDDGINAGWPAYEAALKANGIRYEAFTYPGTNHGFHNDTTPRYNKEAATLAWDRTIAFFNRNLRQS
jgi:carboxymethylenebutenolidase